MAKKWTLAADKADDARKGIREGSKRDEIIDRRRGVPEEPAVGKGGGNRRAVGKGQGMPPPGMPPMPPGPPPPGPMPGGGPPMTPPAGAAPPMPLPPGVKIPKPRMKKRKPMRGPTAGPAPRGPIVPGVGGGKGRHPGKGQGDPVNLKARSTTGPVKGGQRDPKGNYKAGVNSGGKKIGGRGPKY